jgi:hypothetical protein
MTFSALVFTLSLVFIAHNYEEWRGYESLTRAFHSNLNSRLRDRWVFGFALTFLSAVVLLLGVIEWLWGPPPVTIFSRVIVFGLLFNAISHCVLSIKSRELVAGTASALFLIIPVSVMALYAMRYDLGDSAATFVKYILLSLAILPIAIYGSLWLGYYAKRLMTASRQRET